ncbi:hypothetical protein P9597_06845 [Aneurinibacillus migulanus]|uniref:hypothetical protein n=1 Tax=Aneurinibacillus migulanus TaxID=47500 RepID=UPI002E208699|nr:hypothetical protein [Aneurinibacillus migulanus]
MITLCNKCHTPANHQKERFLYDWQPKCSYPLQLKDEVKYGGKVYLVKGVQNKGAYVKIEGLSKPVKTAEVQIVRYGKGLRVI